MKTALLTASWISSIPCPGYKRNLNFERKVGGGNARPLTLPYREKKMKKLLKYLGMVLSCVLLLCLFVACGETPPPGGGTPPTGDSGTTETLDLNVMSFNIRTIATETNAINNWDNRKAAVVDFINNSDADVIGLQEVRQAQFTYIVTNLASNYDGIYYARQSGTNPEGLAVIYDKTAFDVVSSEKYWLSETPETQSYGWGEAYYRIATETLLQHKTTGEYVKTVNTHGPLLDVANTNAYELIVERSLNDDYFTFLCGDFNAHPDELGYVPIAEKLQDCRVAAAESETRGYNTFNGWGSYPDPTTGTGIIDFCFVSKGEDVEVSTYTVHTEKWGDNNENDYSDHYAVQATVKVTCAVNPPSENSFVFEAEDTTFVGGKPAFKEEQTGASNGYAIGGLDSYTFTITLTFNSDKATTARLFIQGCTNAAKYLNVAADGRTLSVNGTPIEKTGAFQGLGWGVYDEWYVATVNLVAGENTIVINQTTKQSFMNVDYFKLVTTAALS